MNQKALSIYYALAIFVLGTALFVFYPSNPETTAWQDGVKHQFSIAWKQTIGDQPVFSSVAYVYDGVSEFYTQSADVMMTMIDHPQSDADIYYVFHEVYVDFASIFQAQPHGNVAGVSTALNTATLPQPEDFMTQPAIYNLVPASEPVTTSVQPAISGSSMVTGQPVNSTDNPWITVQDNATGQLYCLAVYDGTVNKYLGACKNDYY